MLSLTCLVLVSTLTMSYGDLDKPFANLGIEGFLHGLLSVRPMGNGIPGVS